MKKVCKKCNVEKELSEYYKGYEGKLGHSSRCKICLRQDRMNTYNKTKSKTKATRRQKYNSDPIYKLICLCRSRMYKAIKNNSKSKSTMELLGCSGPELKKYLENQFKEGMSWANHGEWHIDHIKPIASFDLKDPTQQKLCFHYTNLQPLWKQDNMEKRDKYNPHQSI